MQRTVPARAGGRSGVRTGLLVAIVVIAVAGVAVPAASFTAANTPREASVAVAEDANGVVGLDKATSVTRNNRETLVTVTNNFGAVVTVTVALVENDGTLYADGASGQTVTFTIAPGDATTVDVEASGNPNTQLVYDVTGDTGDTSFQLPGRSATIQGGNGNGGGNCQGNNPNC